jgi:hypothetical protein
MQVENNSQQIPNNLKVIVWRGKDDIELFARELLGINLHPGQARFAKSSRKINVLSTANRYGKSTLVAVKHIHKAFYKVGVPEGNMRGWLGSEYLTAALAPHSQQAEVVTRTIKQILSSTYPTRSSGTKIETNKCMIGWFMTKVAESYPMLIEYSNGSKTIIRSTGEDKAASIAAKAFGYIGYDEAGKSYHLEEEFHSVLLPRLADFNGTMDLIGTPDATSPSFVFYQELFWRGGGDGNPQEDEYYSQEGSALENPYLPESYFEETRKIFQGDPRLEQVLYGKFISVGDKVFDHRTVLEAARDIPDFTPFEKGHKYIIGVDTAIGEDEIVITVIDWTKAPFRVVRTDGRKGNSQSPQFHLQNIMDIFYHYNQEGTCHIILETFSGESMRYYYDLPQDMRIRTKCFGTGKIVGRVPKRAGQVDRKEDILIAARKLLDKKEIIFSNKLRTLIQQVANYTQKDEKIKTDWVISFCLACFYCTDGQPRTTTLTPQSVNW